MSREITADLFRNRNAQLVGKPGCHIRFMYDTGDMQRCSGADHGNTDKASLGKNDIRIDLFQIFSGFAKALDHSERIRKIFNVQVTAKLSRCDSVIGNIEICDQLLFNAFIGADIGNLIAKFL